MGSWGCRLAVRAHTAMQICQCPLSACLCACVACSHVLATVVCPSPLYWLQPLLGCSSALSGQQLLFSNGRQGNKSFTHSTPQFQSSFCLPLSLSPHSQQINGHKAFLPARRWDVAKFTSRRLSGAGAWPLLELSASPRKL